MRRNSVLARGGLLVGPALDRRPEIPAVAAAVTIDAIVPVGAGRRRPVRGGKAVVGRGSGRCRGGCGRFGAQGRATYPKASDERRNHSRRKACRSTAHRAPPVPTTYSDYD